VIGSEITIITDSGVVEAIPSEGIEKASIPINTALREIPKRIERLKVDL
jgi:hypothetical protein